MGIQEKIQMTNYLLDLLTVSLILAKQIITSTVNAENEGLNEEDFKNTWEKTMELHA